MVIDRAGWWALSEASATEVASAVARTVGARRWTVCPHDVNGHARPVAVFEIRGQRFTLVPGGSAHLGFDGLAFQPTERQETSFGKSPAGRRGDTIQAAVDRCTSPPREVQVAPMLVATMSMEVGIVPTSSADPLILDLVARLGSRTSAHTAGPTPIIRSRPGPPGRPGPRQITWPGQGRVIMTADGSVDRAWLLDAPSCDDEAARLAEFGQRLLTPDEWEYACGAGATTLFRWGNTYPAGEDPGQTLAGPHRMPNAFGLDIGQDSHQVEYTADPDVRCGGDGGQAASTGQGEFLSWLPLATAFRHSPPHDSRPGPSTAAHPTQMRIRPALSLPDW